MLLMAAANPSLRAAKRKSKRTVRRRRLQRPARRQGNRVVRAKSLLGRFRRATMLAVALTSLLLLTFEQPAESAQASIRDEVGSDSKKPQRGAAAVVDQADEVAEATGQEAKFAFDQVRDTAVRNLPKFMVVLALLVLAWIILRLLRWVLGRALGDWPRATAVVALSGVTVWVLAIAVSTMVLAGDVRAFLGSVGLLGLAASWALQTPIESFTGWLLNAFRGYYRVGDRVEVGEVFGDVHRIDVLTTTVWEIGSPFSPGFVRAEQPTGRLITFPNNQILTGSVMNLTRDFPYVWDELSVAVANESDLRYAIGVVEGAARELLSGGMSGAAKDYEAILKHARLEATVSAVPEVFLSIEDAWTSLHVRYLVDVRKRRRTKSDLILRLSEVLNRAEHAHRIIPVIPRQQLQLIGADGLPRNAAWFEPAHSDGEGEGEKKPSVER